MIFQNQSPSFFIFPGFSQSFEKSKTKEVQKTKKQVLQLGEFVKFCDMIFPIVFISLPLEFDLQFIYCIYSLKNGRN